MKPLLSFCSGTFRSFATQSWMLTVLLALLPAAFADAVPGNVPGTVVVSSSDPAKEFFGSPSLAILPGGNYIVSYDIGGDNPRAGRTAVCTSKDHGATWTTLGEVAGLHWATIFSHRDALWLIGISCKVGSIQIRRSDDGGRTWTTPGDAKSGLLAVDGKFHCAPTPVIVHQGRVWRAFEQFAPTGNSRVFRAFMLSAPADSNLLEAANWTRSSAVTSERQWLDVRTASWLEGNAVVTPAGKIVDILRVESHPASGAAWELPGAAKAIPRFEVAAMLEISADGREAQFNTNGGFIHFIGGESKFTIRYDPVSRRYWTLANKITNQRPVSDFVHSPHHQRNVIALTSSADLIDWQEHYRLLRWNEGSVVVKAGSRVGFQYLDWQFEGDDMVAVSRTSWNGINYHDANYITFHRLKNFRTLKMSDSPPDLVSPVDK